MIAIEHLLQTFFTSMVIVFACSKIFGSSVFGYGTRTIPKYIHCCILLHMGTYKVYMSGIPVYIVNKCFGRHNKSWSIDLLEHSGVSNYVCSCQVGIHLVGSNYIGRQTLHRFSFRVSLSLSLYLIAVLFFFPVAQP